MAKRTEQTAQVDESSSNGRTRPGDENLRKKPKQVRAEEIVEKILRTTARLVAEHGAHGVSTTLIAKHAEIPVGTVYRYFNNKEAIFGVLAERYHMEKDLLFDQFLPEDSDNLGTDEYLRHIISGVLDHLRTEEGYRELLKIAIRLPDHYESNMGSVRRWSKAMSEQPRFQGLKMPPKQRDTFYKVWMMTALTVQDMALLTDDPQESKRLEEEMKVIVTSYYNYHEQKSQNKKS